ncbi:uncharacterized protein LOC129222549 [Uloborus diversus]|uniref:uncharacterized protein LOC129222549 n=1 Tax=Uloborus diversus TaxID=327109 RepID=UPI00240A4216|nr:uncharacterized protein LOC129222549 [Uloborus diversus]
MTATIIPVLAAMYLGSTFNLIKYQKGNVDVYSESTLQGNIQSINRSFTRSQYKLVETSNEAREFLDVSGALSLRIKKGEIKLEVPGTYLAETANRQKFVELLIRVQHETVTETIPSHLKPNTGWMDKAPDKVGTHFVRSITYGGELIASLRLKANNREEREKIKAAVATNLQLTGTFDLNANGSFDKLRRDLAGMYKEEIKVMATQKPASPPQTVEALMKLVENYPNEIQKIGNGKGKALKAELYPIASLKKDFPNYLPNSALSSLLDDVETKYDDIRIVREEFTPWNEKRIDATEEEDELVYEMFNALKKAQKEFHAAINDLDVSINGKVEQFKKAFESYGMGKNNIPNRFQRWFGKLKHEITKEGIVWEKPAGSGAVFINWGSDSCQTNSNIERLYVGYAGGTPSKQWAGGRNYECLPDTNPELSKPIKPQPKAAFIEGVSYRSFSEPEKSQQLICAACFVPKTTAVKTFYAHSSCPKDWRKEYSGFAMADSISSVDTDLVCLNKDALKTGLFLAESNQIAKLNPLWMTCTKCNGEKVVPCVVCSTENKAEVF